MEKIMKIKYHLFALAVGIGTVTIGIGFVSAFQLFQWNKKTIEEYPFFIAEQRIIGSVNSGIRQNYPDAVLSPENYSIAQSTSESEENLEAKNQKFDPEGYFYIIGKEKHQQFEDFHSFYVENKDYSSEEGYGKPIAPIGYVNAEKDFEIISEFKYTKISIGSGQIEFETEQKNGINYEFSGHFLENGSFLYLEDKYDENDNWLPNEVLKGTLIKKRIGIEIAKADVEFGWYLEPSCGC
jgi:hypothetical protein